MVSVATRPEAQVNSSPAVASRSLSTDLEISLAAVRSAVSQQKSRSARWTSNVYCVASNRTPTVPSLVV